MAPSTARYADLLARLAGAAQSLGVDMGLGRVRTALARLGDPQRRFAAVQIAGTNGKGSTAAMTEAILRAAGLRTGLYTSPHLARFTERIRVAGREVDGDRLAALDAARRRDRRAADLLRDRHRARLPRLRRGRRRARGAGDRPRRAARRRHDLASRWPPPSPRSASTTRPTSATRCAAIAREKAGILKPSVPCFLGRLPDEADGGDRAPRPRRSARRCAASGRDFPPPRAARRWPARTSGTTPRSRWRWRARLRAGWGATARSGGRRRRRWRSVAWPGRLERVGRRPAARLRAQRGGRAGAGGRAAGAGGRPPGRLS